MAMLNNQRVIVFSVPYVRWPQGTQPSTTWAGSPAEAKTFLRNELNSAAGAATGRSQFGTSEVDEFMMFCSI